MITAILVVSAVALVLHQYFRLKRPGNFPPGPSGIPLLGYAPFIRGPEGFEELSKKYGRIFGMFLGTYPVVVLSDLKLVKEAFGDERMSGRPQSKLFEDFSCGGGKPRGIAFSTGKVWQDQRRFAMRNLREFGLGRASMETMVREEVQDLIDGLKKELNQPVCLEERLLTSLMNSLWFIISGERCNQDSQNIASHIHKITDLVFKKLGVTRTACILFTPSIARAFPQISGYKEFLGNVNEAYDFLKQTVDAHKETLDIKNPRDFIDAYLQEIEKTTDPTSSFWKVEGEKQLLATLLDLNGTGADATTAAINWALLYLVTYPSIQEKIHVEIVNVAGTNRIPSLADRPRMPYMEAVIAETLRFSSMSSLGVPRCTTEAMELNGYKIPKDVVILPNLRQIHFNKERWGDPETFRPERFIDNDGLFKPNEGLIPFSVGKRMCPAENLAKDQMFLFLAGFIQQLRFAIDINKIPTLRPQPSPLFQVPQQYNVIITSRDSLEMYQTGIKFGIPPKILWLCSYAYAPRDLIIIGRSLTGVLSHQE